jgi:hypothetical protein
MELGPGGCRGGLRCCNEKKHRSHNSEAKYAVGRFIGGNLKIAAYVT